MTNDRKKEQGPHGHLRDGVARLQDPNNANAWIEAEYREDWWKRKVMGRDAEEYRQMVHPFYQRCTFCREWYNTQRWGVDSPHCPMCEQWWDFCLGDWFERTEGGVPPEAANGVVCPECRSTNVEVGRAADYDCQCKDCGEAFNARVTA